MRELSIRLILVSLRRHRLVALLLLLQVAATCAVVCNVSAMVVHRMQRMSMPSGVVENALELISARDLQPHTDVLARHQADLASLRAIPGVQSAAAVDALPFSRDTWQVGSGRAGAADDPTGGLKLILYNGTPGELSALGVKLIAGRDFALSDYVPMRVQNNYSGLSDVTSLIVSHDVAEHYFPRQSAVGQQIRIDNRDRLIIGVFAHMGSPSPGRMQQPDNTVFTPMLPDDTGVTYVLRCHPSLCDAAGRKASDVLLANASDRLLEPPKRFSDLRQEYFQRDQTMVALLLASALALLFVTALGIAGLANFWVQQRTRTIGIRRAIGATRGDILRYFQTENFLIVSAGIVLGLFLAVALNLWLMKKYELPRLPLFYLPIGALAMWLLGQLAVLNPALRAAAVPPVVATRSV
ncbi:MAG: FtsX-like permease family protein [Rhodanobacter sp.]